MGRVLRFAQLTATAACTFRVRRLSVAHAERRGRDLLLVRAGQVFVEDVRTNLPYASRNDASELSDIIGPRVSTSRSLLTIQTSQCRAWCFSGPVRTLRIPGFHGRSTMHRAYRVYQAKKQICSDRWTHRSRTTNAKTQSPMVAWRARTVGSDAGGLLCVYRRCTQ